MQCYELNQGSDTMFWVYEGVFLAFAGFFSLTLTGSILAMKAHKNGRKGWTGALWFLVTWIPMILLSARTQARASSETGMMQTIDSQGSQAALNGSPVKSGTAAWLAVSILGLPLFLWGVVSTGLLEPPLRVGVSASQIDVLYRFSWRNWSIPMASVTDVKLKRYNFFDHGVDGHSYDLVITHNGEETKLASEHRDYYEQILSQDLQVHAACRAINRYVMAKNNQNSTLH